MEKCPDLHTDTDTTTDNNLSVVREDVTGADDLGGGVSVRGKPTERQEWSFTLYDLDGQGRVTKEEVAQLLKSLYDAVGSSIDLPEAGTKSLKLHLTVAPDKTKTPEVPEVPEDLDLNCKECNSDKDKSQKKDINSKLNNGVVASKLAHKSLLEAGPLKVQLPNNLSKAHKDGHTHSTMKRISALEQKQLAELVEFNMQRNKEKKLRHSHGQHSGKSKKSTIHLSHVLENPDRRSYYLDLAGIENPSSFTFPVSPETTGLSTSVQPRLRTKSKGLSQRRSNDKSVSQGHIFKDYVFGPTETGSKNQPEHSKQTKTHFASPSHNMTKSPTIAHRKPSNGKSKAVISVSHHKRSGSGSPHKYCCKSSPRHEAGYPTEVLTENVEQVAEPASPIKAGAKTSGDTPKHRRHKQKEKNHVRAMLQVAKWIEQEHTPDLENVTVEKHEHHHFHEHHHHHHYHHYHQAT